MDSFSGRVEIAKVEDEQRLVFGFAKVASLDGASLYADLENDVVEPDELADAAYGYVSKSRQVSAPHKAPIRATLVESFVLTPEKLEAMGLAPEVAKAAPRGWWVGYHVEDDAVWAAVKGGKVRSFSIGGDAVRVEVPAA